MTESEVRSRILKINSQLRNQGKSWDEVEAFWQEVFAECKARGLKKQPKDYGNTPGEKPQSTGEVYIKSKTQ